MVVSKAESPPPKSPDAEIDPRTGLKRTPSGRGSTFGGKRKKKKDPFYRRDPACERGKLSDMIEMSPGVVLFEDHQEIAKGPPVQLEPRNEVAVGEALERRGGKGDKRGARAERRGREKGGRARPSARPPRLCGRAWPRW